jgi:hypothetical protein
MSINPYQAPLAPAVTEPRERYRPTSTLAQWLTVLFIAGAVLDTSSGAMVAIQAATFSDLESAIEAEVPGALALALGFVLQAMLAIPLYITTVILFCVWVHRTNRNARALGALGMNFTPGWSVGWFFVPIMNLFKPYQAVKEIYQSSEPDLDQGRWYNVDVPATLGWWWGLWIIYNVLGQIDFRLNLRGGPELATLTSWLGVVSSFIGVFTCLLALTVVRMIHSRQEEKARLQLAAARGGSPMEG